MSKLKILVTGATGQLGNEIKDIAEEYPEYELHFFNREQLDLSDESAIKSVSNSDWDYLINGAAYTQVDQAETDQTLAKLINTDALNYFSKYLPASTKIIHVSTDYVYHLDKNSPLSEGDICNPQGVYAKTKLAGEQFLLENRPDAVIIRTSWVYSYYGKNFVKSMIRLGSSRDNLSIVADQIGSPTYAKDIAKTILDIVNHQQWMPGIYNFSNEGTTTWAKFAEKIFEIKGITCKVSPISTEEFGAPAPRPKWSVLDKSKIKSTYDIKIPHWEDSLKKCLALLN